MKHTLRTIIWVIAMTLGVCASAQTDTKRAFRMYMHDGSVQFFFYSDIQSMTVGYEDGDMERPVQIINTPDSVYTFAMADIDSVSFARPVTEYKSNVVRLEDGLLPYVIACDSLTLTFRSDVPRNLLPPVGTPLFTFESNEILPSGFMGELVELREEGDVIAVCSGVDITDVFDNLFFAMGEEPPVVPDDDKRRRQWIHDGDIPVGDIGFRLPATAWNHISAGLGDISGSYGQTAGYNISTSKFHARLFVLCENGEASFSFTSTGKHMLTLDSSVAVNAAVSDDLPLITLDIPIPNCPMLELGFNFGLCYSLGGGFAFDFRSEIPFTTVLHFSGGIKDVGNHWGAATNNIVNTGSVIFDSPTTHFIAEGNLTAELGVYGAIDIHPKFWKSEFISVDKRKLAFSGGIRTGWRFSSEWPNFSYASPVEQANTEFYDELNGKDVYKLQQFLTGYIKLENGFGQNLEFPWDFHVWEPVWSRGIVPEFVNVSLDETGNGGTLSASATLTRKLATYANAGFALYDENKRLVDQWWDSGFYTDREGATITHDFSNLKTGVNYVVHPLVRSNRAEMVANPSSSNQIEPSIYTQVAKNITQSSATLTALITKMPENRNFKAGFVYYDTPDNKKTVVVDNNTANVIAEISGLKANTDYSFYAFMQIGDYIETGETKVFKTEEEKEEVDLSGIDIWISPISAYFIFPNINTYAQACNTSMNLYSNLEMTDMEMRLGLWHGENTFTGWCSGHISGLKPSTTYWYKIEDVSSPEKSITGSFTTTSGVNISTPSVQCDFNLYDGQTIFESISYDYEKGMQIGTIREATVKFDSPEILSGVSSDLFVYDCISGSEFIMGGDKITKGIIYSDSPDNLTFLNPDISHPMVYDNETHSLCRSEVLKPGTYYYRAYYQDASNFRILHKDDGTKVLIGPNGEEIGVVPTVGTSEATYIMWHRSSYYGEIKEFTVPEIVYF